MTAGPQGGTRTYLHTRGISSWRLTRQVQRPSVKVNVHATHAFCCFLHSYQYIDFVDAITRDWGGKPFIDLQKGWKYALDKYPEIDPDRAVAAGASWGGYAIK